MMVLWAGPTTCLYMQFAINKFSTALTSELRKLAGSNLAERFEFDDSVYIDTSFDPDAIQSPPPPSSTTPDSPESRRRLSDWVRP